VKKREGADETWMAARDALKLVRTLIASGEERKAKDAALAMAILIDKSAVLENASALADERAAKLSQGQGEAIAAAIMGMLEDLGIPLVPAMKDVLLHHFRPLESGASLRVGSAPDAGVARQQLRARINDSPSGRFADKSVPSPESRAVDLPTRDHPATR
jgi:hypothetical protein